MIAPRSNRGRRRRELGIGKQEWTGGGLINRGEVMFIHQCLPSSLSLSSIYTTRNYFTHSGPDTCQLGFFFLGLGSWMSTGLLTGGACLYATVVLGLHIGASGYGMLAGGNVQSKGSETCFEGVVLLSYSYIYKRITCSLIQVDLVSDRPGGACL